MRSRILSTRNTSKTYILFNTLFPIILYGFIIFWLLNKAQALSDSYWHRDKAGSLIYCAILFAIVALIQIIYHGIVGRTYLDVYEGRIRGTGMCKLQMQSFDLKWEQVVSLTTSTGSLLDSASPGMYLIVSTSAANYKVITTKDRAEEIAAYYNAYWDNKNIQQ